MMAVPGDCRAAPNRAPLLYAGRIHSCGQICRRTCSKIEEVPPGLSLVCSHAWHHAALQVAYRSASPGTARTAVSCASLQRAKWEAVVHSGKARQPRESAARGGAQAHLGITVWTQPKPHHCPVDSNVAEYCACSTCMQARAVPKPPPAPIATGPSPPYMVAWLLCRWRGSRPRGLLSTRVPAKVLLPSRLLSRSRCPACLIRLLRLRRRCRCKRRERLPEVRRLGAQRAGAAAAIVCLRLRDRQAASQQARDKQSHTFRLVE